MSNLIVSKQKLGAQQYERTQLKTSYLARELEGTNEEVKRPQRERVARFFAEHQSLLRRRCFCLPGARWAFENELKQHITNIDFIGIERNWSIIEHGIRYMPGYKLLLDDVSTRWKRFQGFSTDQAKILWSPASHFMLTGPEEHLSKRIKERWNKAYKGWTCAWLDFSSPINSEVIACCKELEKFLHVFADTVPVAITFMVGRELPSEFQIIRQMGDGTDKIHDRAEFFRAICETNYKWTPELVDCWGYESAGGCPMGIATYLFHNDYRGKEKPTRRQQCKDLKTENL